MNTKAKLKRKNTATQKLLEVLNMASLVSPGRFLCRSGKLCCILVVKLLAMFKRLTATVSAVIDNSLTIGSNVALSSCRTQFHKSNGELFSDETTANQGLHFSSNQRQSYFCLTLSQVEGPHFSSNRKRSYFLV